MKLTDSDIQTCVHGLCVAADRFDADAATSREIGDPRLAEQFERQAKETRELARRLEDAAGVDVDGAMSRDAFLRACAANKALRFADGRYVVAAERSTDRAICWAGVVDGAVLRAIFAEIVGSIAEYEADAKKYGTPEAQAKPAEPEADHGIPDEQELMGAAPGAALRGLLGAQGV